MDLGRRVDVPRVDLGILFGELRLEITSTVGAGGSNRPAGQSLGGSFGRPYGPADPQV